MKTLTVVLLCIIFCLSGCNGTQKEPPIVTSDALLSVLSSVPTFGESIVYTEETDTNELLGRPNQYIGKSIFSDTRCEQIEDELTGGTFEIFSTKKDCDSRHEYLLKLSDPSLGVFGVNQYIYKYPTVILRIDFDLTSKQAEEYRDVMSEYLDEKYEQNYAEQ